MLKTIYSPFYSRNSREGVGYGRAYDVSTARQCFCNSSHCQKGETKVPHSSFKSEFEECAWFVTSQLVWSQSWFSMQLTQVWCGKLDLLHILKHVWRGSLRYWDQDVYSVKNELVLVDKLYTVDSSPFHAACSRPECCAVSPPRCSG